MKIFAIGLILTFALAPLLNAQKKFSVFPKTNFQIVLPDTSFHYDKKDDRFFSKKYLSSITFGNNDDSLPAMVPFDALVRSITQEMQKEDGSTIIWDSTLAPNSRILVKIFSPGIAGSLKPSVPAYGFLYFYRYHDSYVIAAAMYKSEFDKVLGPLMLASFKTFSAVDESKPAVFYKDQ